MKNLIIIVVTVLVVGFVGFSLLSKKTPSLPVNNTANTSSDTPQNENIEQTGDSRYVEYSKSALSNSKDKKRVLFFYANWCPTCVPADSNFRRKESQIPEDVVLIRVNYNDDDTDDEEQALANKYGITYQHTFVQIDSEGGVVNKWNGTKNFEDLLENIL